MPELDGHQSRIHPSGRLASGGLGVGPDGSHLTATAVPDNENDVTIGHGPTAGGHGVLRVE